MQIFYWKKVDLVIVNRFRAVTVSFYVESIVESSSNRRWIDYDGVCKWGTRSTYNCFEIDFKTCLNGVCVDPPPMPTNPTTLSECSESTKLFDCTAFPAPTCRDATTLAYVQDASQVSCTDAEVQGIFKCRYNLVRYDCATLNGAVCSNGACVQVRTVFYHYWHVVVIVVFLHTGLDFCVSMLGSISKRFLSARHWIVSEWRLVRLLFLPNIQILLEIKYDFFFHYKKYDTNCPMQSSMYQWANL